MLPITRILFVIVFSAAACGCVSPQSVGPEQGETFTIEDRSYTEVWNAAVQAVASVADIKSMDKAKGEVRGLRSPSTWRGAEAIAVFISPTDDASWHFQVSVVSEHVLKTELAGKDFKETIMGLMREQLGMAY
jgi:hypothetical protein